MRPLLDPASTPSPIAALFPGYFALVMATGIVAIAAAQQDLDSVAKALYVVAMIAYVTLVVLHILRLLRFWRAFVADLTGHATGFAFLTSVAATNVLAAASIVIHGWWTVAWVLWWVSLVLWVTCIYATLVAIVISDEKPHLGAGINGSWFLVAVSTQSIAAVAGLLATRSESDLLAFIGVGAFGLGIVWYLIVLTLLVLRWTFHPVDPVETGPPSWIAAGAGAITVLAGSNLLIAGERGVVRLARIAPFLEGTVVLAWATASFWFPFLIAIGIWRHLSHRVPLRYHPSYWAMVFPLGMYGAATFAMRAAIDLDALSWLPKVELAIALALWSVTFAAMVWDFAKRAKHADISSTSTS